MLINATNIVLLQPHFFNSIDSTPSLQLPCEAPGEALKQWGAKMKIFIEEINGSESKIYDIVTYQVINHVYF